VHNSRRPLHRLQCFGNAKPNPNFDVRHFEPKIIIICGYPKIIPLPSLNTLGSFVF